MILLPIRAPIPVDKRMFTRWERGRCHVVTSENSGENLPREGAPSGEGHDGPPNLPGGNQAPSGSEAATAPTMRLGIGVISRRNET